jgi:hypothetical protein
VLERSNIHILCEETTGALVGLGVCGCGTTVGVGTRVGTGDGEGAGDGEGDKVGEGEGESNGVFSLIETFGLKIIKDPTSSKAKINVRIFDFTTHCSKIVL